MNRVISLNPSAPEVFHVARGGRGHRRNRIRIEIMRFVAHSGLARDAQCHSLDQIADTHSLSQDQQARSGEGGFSIHANSYDSEVQQDHAR